MGSTFVFLCRRCLPPGIGTSLSKNTGHNTFHADIFCLNLDSQGDSVWCQCIDSCLVSGVMCATHVSSPVMIPSRNSPLQKCQCRLHALCFVFWWQLVCSVLSKRYQRSSYTVNESWNRSLYLLPLQRCYCDNLGSLASACVMRLITLSRISYVYHVYAVFSPNEWFTSWGMSGKLTLWTSFVYML